MQNSIYYILISIFLSIFFSHSGIGKAIILISSIFLVMKWMIINHKSKPFPLPPGPKPWPIVGCFPQMLINKPAFQWIHKLMEEMDTEIACIRLGTVHVITVTSPELACEFLKKQDHIFSSRPICMSAKLTSNGYLTSLFVPLGDQWMKMRRILSSHVLSPASLEWLRDKRDEEADHLIRYIYNQCNKSVINVRTVSRFYCGNVIRKMILNKRFFGKGILEDRGLSVEEQEHIDALFNLSGYLYNFGISDYFPWLSVFDFDGHKAIIKKAFTTTRKHIDPEVDRRIKMWKDGVRTVEEDILDVLIVLKDTNGKSLLNVEEIKAQVLEFMLAAIDNPSNAIEWALGEMLNQPNILERAIEELDTVVGSNRLVQESDLPQLNYVKACIKEAFRLHPVWAFNIPHVSVSDSTVAEYFIPKGSVVLLSRRGLGRNPRVWEQPTKFMPERHLTNEESEVALSDSELHMISFSTGRRGCPAYKLGSTMTTMLLARLLQGFTWSLPPNLPHNDLSESRNELFLATQLLTQAKPRLAKDVYP